MRGGLALGGSWTEWGGAGGVGPEDRAGSVLDAATALECASEGDLVGVLQIAADRQA